MSERAKEALAGAIPRWVTAITMAICAFYLSRTMKQIDQLSETQRTQTASFAVQAATIDVIQKNYDKTADALGKVDQIARLLEQRLVRLETKEENRRHN